LVQVSPSDKPKDQVVALGAGVNPGDQVQVDTVITLLVSDNSMMKMPQLTNLMPEDALKQLQAPELGWQGDEKYFTQQNAPNPNPALWGRVVDQLPKAGDLVAKTTLVTVSIGVEPRISVPDLSGMTKDQVMAAMKDAGWRGELTVVTDGGQDPPAGKDGTVIPGSQDPAAGSEIRMTDGVTVHIYPEATPPETTSSSNNGGGRGNGGG
jgi:beta-lactam-binding protein with PASTA domain